MVCTYADADVSSGACARQLSPSIFLKDLPPGVRSNVQCDDAANYRPSDAPDADAPPRKVPRTRE